MFQIYVQWVNKFGTHLYIKPTQQTTQASTITPRTIAAVPAGEPLDAVMEAHYRNEKESLIHDVILVAVNYYIYSPTDTLTLALATARLTSFVKETLMQNTPESLKN